MVFPKSENSLDILGVTVTKMMSFRLNFFFPGTPIIYILFSHTLFMFSMRGPMNTSMPKFGCSPKIRTGNKMYVSF